MAELFLFPALLERFRREHAPLLHDQLADFTARKPLAGVTILHNVPVTLTTVVKIGVLVAGGADVTVTGTEYVPSDPKAVALIEAASKMCPRIRWIESHAECAGKVRSLFCACRGATLPTGREFRPCLAGLSLPQLHHQRQ